MNNQNTSLDSSLTNKSSNIMFILIIAGSICGIVILILSILILSFIFPPNAPVQDSQTINENASSINNSSSSSSQISSQIFQNGQSKKVIYSNWINNDLSFYYLDLSTQNPQKIASDSSIIKVLDAKFDNEGNIRSIECTTNKCMSVEYDSNLLFKNKVDLNIPDISNRNIINAYLSDDMSYIVFTQDDTSNTRTTESTYIYAQGIYKKIISWKYLDGGIGGSFCDGVKFSFDSKYFTFCASSAVGTSVMGQMFIFQNDGTLVNKVGDNIMTNNSSNNVSSVIFIGNDSLMYVINNNIIKLNIVSLKEEHPTLDLKDYGVSLLGMDLSKKYLIISATPAPYIVSNNNKPNLIYYYSISDKTILSQKPSNIIDPADVIQVHITDLDPYEVNIY